MGIRRKKSLNKTGLAAAGIAGTALAIVTLNKIVENNAPKPQFPLGIAPQMFDWSKGKISYTVNGAGQSIILLHGIYAGASSYEFRNVFTALTQKYRVFAPDLPGFGLSEKKFASFTPELYADFILDFTLQVVGGLDQPAFVIASSLGAAFIIKAAAQRPDLFDKLVLVEPSGIKSLAQKPRMEQRLAKRILSSPIVGQSLYNAIVSASGLRTFLSRQVYWDPTAVSDDMVDMYFAMSHQPGSRFAIANFIGGNLNADIKASYESLRQPIFICWGKNSRLAPFSDTETFLHLNRQAELAIFDNSCGLPHDEEPLDFAEQVIAWLQSSVSSRS